MKLEFGVPNLASSHDITVVLITLYLVIVLFRNCNYFFFAFVFAYGGTSRVKSLKNFWGWISYIRGALYKTGCYYPRKLEGRNFEGVVFLTRRNY